MALSGKRDRRTRDKNGFIKTAFFVGFVSIVVAFVGTFLFGGGDFKLFSDVNIIGMAKFIISDPAFDRAKGMYGLYAAFFFFLILFCYIYLDYEKKKNSRVGEEYGSSKLLTAKELKNFKRLFFYDPSIVKKYRRHARTVFDRDEYKTVCKRIPKGKRIERECFMNCKVLGKDVYMSMNTKFINRNLNMLIIGGSGSAKSVAGMFGNILMGSCNYIITDPSGEILKKMGHFLEDVKLYKIKVFNIDDFTKSMKYNPILYARTEKDINILVDAINRNIKPDLKSGKGDDFFDDAKDILMVSLIALVKELYPVEGKMNEKTRRRNRKKQTFKNIMRLLTMAKLEAEADIDGDGLNATSTLDTLFDKLYRHNPRSYAAACWKSFRTGSAKVCNEAIISACAVYSRIFNTDAVEWLTSEDELNLYDLASDEPCALFIVTPSSDISYNFLASMIYTQLFSIITKAGKEYAEENNLSNPALPRHVSFWLDEFANTGKIPQFLELLSVVRKYNISINVIIQAISQLKGMYKDSWETIVGNMDAMLYLGGQEPGTVKMLSEKIGKETVKAHSYSLSKRNGDSESYHNISRSLLSPDEIEKMAKAYELVFITGCKPIQTKKYDITTHPNYKHSGLYSEKNNYDLSALIGDSTPDIKALDEAAITENEVRDFKFS